MTLKQFEFSFVVMDDDRDFYAMFCVTFLFGVLFLVIVALLLYVCKKDWKRRRIQNQQMAANADGTHTVKSIFYKLYRTIISREYNPRI